MQCMHILSPPNALAPTGLEPAITGLRQALDALAQAFDVLQRVSAGDTASLDVPHSPFAGEGSRP
jgi:hypothetical protein